MPFTVADIYSQADRLKRRVKDIASNPLESLLQTVGYGQQRAQEFQGLNEIALQGDLARMRGQEPTAEQVAAENKVRDIWASAYNPAGITVFHGSPYLFRQFNPAKMGSGEGAQAYGAGAGYTAEARPVAEEYARNISRQKLMEGTVQGHPLQQMIGNKPLQDYYAELDRQAARLHPSQSEDAYAKLDLVEKLGLGSNIPEVRQYAQEAGYSKNVLNWLDKDLAPKYKPAGYLYEGDIPDELLPKFLDWDKPLSQQAPEAQVLAKQYGLNLDDLGGDLVAKVGKNLKGSEILEKAGLKGIRYFDANSRNAQYGSANFIPFRAEDFQVKKINDIPLHEWEAKGAFK